MRGLVPTTAAIALAIALLTAAAAALGQTAEPEPDGGPDEVPGFSDEIDVVSTTPLGSGLPAERTPWSSRRTSGEALRSGPLGAGLERGLAGVHASEAQGSAAQSDLFFRGFGTSPLLGAAQGMSVFFDGVRINEIFGDIVQWDLVQQEALAEVEVVAGAQAGYGVNTLGGAVQLRTDDGFRHRGQQVSLRAGSWRARGLAIRSGAAHGPDAYFLAASGHDEEGWRDASPVTTRQALAKLDRRRDSGVIELALDIADNDLVGNGAAPRQLLDRDRSAIFTYPDETHNELFFPRLRVEHALTPDDRLSATVFYRDSDIDTLNADEHEGFPPGDAESFDGANNRSHTRQSSYGMTVELSRADWLPGEGNLLVAGASWEGGDASFDSSTELATLTADRTTVGSGLFDEESFVAVGASVERTSLYLVDNAPLAAGVTLHLQARLNRTRIALRDRLGVELDGDHEWQRLHPAIGLVFSPDPGAGGIEIFAGLAQSSRTPTPVELTCADPEDPCRLPNAFVADPPLADVVTTTFELGARGRFDSGSWSVGTFGARSDDDILFVSSGRLTSSGHFTNVDRTRRIGFDAAARGGKGRWQWHASYSWVEATFETPIRVPSPTHPLADGGEIAVEPGDRIPGIPRRMAKAGVAADAGRLRLGADARAFSSRVIRGDEGNLLDGVPGYAVADVWLEAATGAHMTLRVAVENVFDRETHSFGVLGDPSEVLGDAFDDPIFLSPGTPRTLRLEAALALGGGRGSTR